MGLKVPDLGEREMLGMLIGGSEFANATFDLYKNNHVPGDADVAGDYTIADYAGYSTEALTGPVLAITNTAGRATASFDAIVFPAPSSSTQTVYGYVVVALGGAILWAEKFTVPVVMAAGGSNFTVTPRLTLRSEL